MYKSVFCFKNEIRTSIKDVLTTIYYVALKIAYRNQNKFNCKYLNMYFIYKVNMTIPNIVK